MRHAAFVVAAIGGAFAAGAIQAQDDGKLTIDVADCVEIESPSERFRCYESRVDAALGEAAASSASRAPAAGSSSAEAPAAAQSAAAEASAATSSPRTETRASRSETSAENASRASRAANVVAEREIEAAPSAAADDFGLTRASDTQARENRRQTEELFATVASVRETVPNSYVITLDNGQVWRQMRPRFYPLQPGNRVRIYSTNWGSSYRMSAEELKGFIQVERIR